MEKIRVVIADDHPLIREGLRRVLELDENIEIAGEVGDGQGAINLARSLRPDIILMDLKMPGTSGKEASRVIRREMPDIKIIILTVAEDEEMLEVIKAGASGYLLKDVEPAELMKSIYDVLEGRPAFHPVVTGRLLGEYNRLSTATAKEEGISALTEAGSAIKEPGGQSHRRSALYPVLYKVQKGGPLKPPLHPKALHLRLPDRPGQRALGKLELLQAGR